MSSADLSSFNMAIPNSAATNKSQGGVQSLEIGLSILDVLIAQNEPMMLKDIAQVMDMHPAKMHRYLVSLIRKDYALQLSDGRYGLGSRIKDLGALSALGHAGVNQNNILERLMAAANAIKDSLNCGVQIAKWFSEGPIIIGSVEPDSPISIVTRIGSRMPLTTSATGQLFASYQANTVIKPLVLAEWQNKADDINNIGADDIAIKWQAFTALQTRILSQAYATVTGDMVMGINAIAIPILVPVKSPIHKPKLPSELDNIELMSVSTDSFLEYAITVIGTSEQLPMDQQHEVFNKIMAIIQRYQLS